jgi:hypothetical protein
MKMQSGLVLSTRRNRSPHYVFTQAEYRGPNDVLTDLLDAMREARRNVFVVCGSCDISHAGEELKTRLRVTLEALKQRKVDVCLYIYEEPAELLGQLADEGALRIGRLEDPPDCASWDIDGLVYQIHESEEICHPGPYLRAEPVAA